jgi:small nuclear ribonucleoprotein (snRNP)-like protein
MSFYFLIFWFLELRESSYWPNYSHNTIGKKSLYNLPVEIELSNQLNISGRLTNWDENSCFIALDSSIEARNESVSIKVEYENREFVNIGEIVSSYDSGIGVRLDSQQRPLSFSWNDFYLVIKERGLAPYYLKG